MLKLLTQHMSHSTAGGRLNKNWLSNNVPYQQKTDSAKTDSAKTDSAVTHLTQQKLMTQQKLTQQNKNLLGKNAPRHQKH